MNTGQKSQRLKTPEVPCEIVFCRLRFLEWSFECSLLDESSARERERGTRPGNIPAEGARARAHAQHILCPCCSWLRPQFLESSNSVVGCHAQRVGTMRPQPQRSTGSCGLAWTRVVTLVLLAAIATQPSAACVRCGHGVALPPSASFSAPHTGEEARRPPLARTTVVSSHPVV